MDADRTRELPYEIEMWNRDGESHVWVKVPELAGTNTSIWALWGLDSMTNPPAYTTNGATWNTNYLGVWHLGAPAAGVFQDATAYTNHGADVNTAVGGGVVGDAVNLAGTCNINLTGLTSLKQFYTFEFLVRSWEYSTGDYLFDSQSGRLIFAFNRPAAGQVGYYENNTWRDSAGSGLNDDQWHHVVYALNAQSNTCVVYVDGVQAGSLAYAFPRNIGGAVRIGSVYDGTGQHYDGLMDEFRLSTMVRSADWIAATFGSQMRNAAFTRYDAVTTTVPDLAVANRPASGVANRQATLRGVVLNTGGAGNPDVYICWGTANGGDSTSAWQQISDLGTNWGAAELFETTVNTLEPEQTYYYRCYVKKGGSDAWADGVVSFTTVPELYVSLNGNHSAGTNWATAFTNLQTALDQGQTGLIYVAGQTFNVTSNIYWSQSAVTIRGGYAATNETGPGPWDPVQWPTLLIRPISAAYTNRILFIDRVTNGCLDSVTLAQGYTDGPGWAGSYGNAYTNHGAGIYVYHSFGLLLTNCTIRQNRANTPQGNSGYLYGGGIFAFNSEGVMANCTLFSNRVSTQTGSTVSHGHGGGIYASGGRWTLRDCAIISNVANGASAATSYGGGLAIAGWFEFERCVIRHNDITVAGTIIGDGLCVLDGGAILRNCVVANNGGPGYYQVAGRGWFDYCTVADNATYGLYRAAAGSIVVSNAILWNNNDDVYEPVAGGVQLGYSCVEDGDNLGVNGCVDSPPLFVDNAYFHLQSTYGDYRGGYFTGGSWDVSASNSPLIDVGAPERSPEFEPHPNGARVNMGAYGNSATASKSAPMAVTNRAPSAVTPISATLNAELLQVGSPGVQAWFYWGLADGGTNPLAWDTNRWVGSLADVGVFSLSVTGLLTGNTYYYAAFVSNGSATTVWAQPSTNFGAEIARPEISNRGVSNEVGPTVTLYGEVTSTGGDDPDCYFCWGPVDGGSAGTGAWPYAVAMGPQSGVFTTDITTLPGSNYFYTCYATNAAGEDWAIPSIAFGAQQIIYVNADATGLGTGYNWADALTTVTAALANCSALKTNLIYLKGGSGGTFVPVQQIDWTQSNVIIEGGYEGVGLPGAADAESWPTILTKTPANVIRILAIDGVTNGVLRRVTVAGGGLPDHGAGLWINNASNLLIDTCVIYSNVSADAGTFTYGGGIYAKDSWLTLVNSRLERNVSQSIGASYRNFGGGLFVSNGAALIQDTEFVYNRARATGTTAWGHGAGLYVASGAHVVRNCLFVQNEARGVSDNTTDSRGDGILHAGGTLAIAQSTFAGNIGEGLRGNAGTTVTNSLFWLNRDDIVGVTALAQSCIGDGDNAGTNGCFSADPLFERGFYLTPGSPCIDAGAETAAAAGYDALTTRADGTTDAGLLDVGYHARTGLNPRWAELYVAPGGDDGNSGTNAAQPLATVRAALGRTGLGSRIHLAAGVYDAGSGETFPIYFD